MESLAGIAGSSVADQEDREWCLPAVLLDRNGHRPKFQETVQPFNAFVVRVLTRKEIANRPEAQEALRKEFDRLRDMKCWIEEEVREEDNAKSDAKETGEKCHFGDVFGICGVKNCPLGTHEESTRDVVSLKAVMLKMKMVLWQCSWNCLVARLPWMLVRRVMPRA